ncbi:MAG: GNAT family N-acetyltransferase [Nitratireductor sp.]
MVEENTYHIKILSSLSEIDPQTWDSLAASQAPVSTHTSRYNFEVENPFLTHAFLYALEESGSACQETGWLAQHLVLESTSGEVLAAMPCYLKNHSQGEYVFDHNWADALHRAGGHYYPKLQCSIPFTPATTPKILNGGHANKDTHASALFSGLKQLTHKIGASSAHITFMPKDEWRMAEDIGLLQREDRQFHWQNDSYDNFEAFLATLSSRKRKNIKKERRLASSIDGLEILHFTGDSLSDEVMEAFFDFYLDTGSRKWGQPYLTQKFYTLIKERMSERILLVMAKRDGNFVAGAINFIGNETLYGRHWGCIEDHPFLHFEICYYQAIEYAITHGLKRVEAGAQGEHKLARGYIPTTTYSSHYFANNSFNRAIESYLEEERRHVKMEKDFLMNHIPFRKEK